MKTKLFYILLASLTIGYGYYFLPTIGLGFYGIPNFFFLLFLFLYFREIYKKKNIDYYKIPLLVPTIFWVYSFIYPLTVFFTTAALFNSGQYQQLIGEVKLGKDLSEHLAPVSIEDIAIVDIYTANRLGDKVMGSIPSLGCQTKIGHFTLQKVKNKLFWVAPLLHSGYFKWKNNKEGTPGYIMVSATSDRDVRLVQMVDNKEVKIKYQPNAFFADNLSRHIYFNGYSNQGFTDFTFELDDLGNPFWVVTLYDKQVGFSGREATGVITINPENGNITEYTIEASPKWIDRIQPANFVMVQLNDWGEYVNGFWNLSNQDKLMTTSGVTLVFGPEKQAYWYTGLTSVGNDEGTVGFALINTRSKETIWYTQVGATEEAAQLSAKGKVQEKRYQASFPVTYNINGIPTYIMSLKDNAGLIKMIAMVSVEDYTIVGVGGTIKEALRAFKNALNSTGNMIELNSKSEQKEIADIVSRINADVRSGNTYYYFMVKNHKEIFAGSSLLSTELVLTEKGDSVKFQFDDTTSQTVDLVRFDNLEIDSDDK